MADVVMEEDNKDVQSLLPEYLRLKEDVVLAAKAIKQGDGEFGGYVVEELGIEVQAPSEAEACSQLARELRFLWNGVAMERDDLLAPDARELKAKLHLFFEEVRDS